MTINKAGLDLIKEFEGLRLEAYPDPGSKDGTPWTIGYGHTRDVKRGDKITAAQAEAFLLDDLKTTYGVIAEYVKPELNENQYAALVSFVFNIGETLFAKSSVLKFINDNKLDSVPGRMALYRMNDGKVMAGLVRRRTAEGALWMKQINIIQEAPEVGSNVPAKPDNPKKPFDWGATGAFITLLAGLSDQAKKLIGNVTTAIGVEPWILLVVVGVGFGAWTIYSKWKDK
jgi:lysozyme